MCVWLHLCWSGAECKVSSVEHSSILTAQKLCCKPSGITQSGAEHETSDTVSELITGQRGGARWWRCPHLVARSINCGHHYLLLCHCELMTEVHPQSLKGRSLLLDGSFGAPKLPQVRADLFGTVLPRSTCAHRDGGGERLARSSFAVRSSVRARFPPASDHRFVLYTAHMNILCSNYEH